MRPDERCLICLSMWYAAQAHKRFMKYCGDLVTKTPRSLLSKLLLFGVIGLAIASAGAIYWYKELRSTLPEGFVSTNGRIEAQEVQVATKIAGRVTDVAFDEGDLVQQGAIIARIDDAQIKAQLAVAQAQAAEAVEARAQAVSVIAQRQSQTLFARQQLSRSVVLQKRGYATNEQLDQAKSTLDAAVAASNAAKAALAQSEAAIAAANANVTNLQSVLDDTIIRAPRTGRVEYRLAEPGEVLAAGGRVMTLLDLSDVYMTIFLPASDAGKLAMGAQARLVLDPVPQYVVPATVSFVAAEAQFTPKTVETDDERKDLMFRVKLKIAPALLQEHIAKVKTGVRGIAYVQLSAQAPWPDNLAVKLP